MEVRGRPLVLQAELDRVVTVAGGKTGGSASPVARHSLAEGGRRRWQKDVPEEVKQKLEFIAVENVDEALAVALEKGGAVPASQGKSA
jgi:hypothetical protein